MTRFSSLSLTALLTMLLVGGSAIAQEAEEADDAQQIQQNQEQQQTEAREEEEATDDEARPEIREEVPAPPGFERDEFAPDRAFDPRREDEARRDPAERPALGVRLHPAAPGLVVQQVVPGSPAAEAGLQPGDQILMMNETQYADAPSFVGAIGQMDPGSEVTLQIQRAGQQHELSIELGTWQQVFAEREQEFDQQQGFPGRPGFPQPREALRPQFNGAPAQQMQQEIQQLRQTVEQLQRELEQLRQQINGVDRPVPAPADEAAPPTLPPAEPAAAPPAEPQEQDEEDEEEAEDNET